MKKLIALIAIAVVFTACSSAPATEVPAADSTAVVACDTTAKCCAKADSTVADSTKK